MSFNITPANGFLIEQFRDGSIGVTWSEAGISEEIAYEGSTILRAGDGEAICGATFETLQAWIQANPNEALVSIRAGAIQAMTESEATADFE